MDDDGCGLGCLIWLIIAVLAIELIVTVGAYLGLGAAALCGAGGAVWGAGHAIKNYAQAFKETVIDALRPKK